MGVQKINCSFVNQRSSIRLLQVIVKNIVEFREFYIQSLKFHSKITFFLEWINYCWCLSSVLIVGFHQEIAVFGVFKVIRTQLRTYQRHQLQKPALSPFASADTPPLYDTVEIRSLNHSCRETS